MHNAIKILAFICVGLPLGALLAVGLCLNKLTGGLFKGALDILADLALKPDRTLKRLFEGREENLYRAVREGNTKRLRELVTSNVNADGQKALWLAVQDFNPDTVDILLKSGVEPNCRDEFNNNALHEATYRYRNNLTPTVFNTLINAGVDINAHNAKGHTPLHMAIMKGNIEATQNLIARGADITVRTQHGKTATALAMEINRADIALLVTPTPPARRGGALPAKPAPGP